ncbi:MAG: hypothetical protein STHCBS139747_001776 [Sporothrix thermara]
MPARTNGSATTVTTKSRRFELPALDFKFGSLTEGTNIPPPLPSPVDEEPLAAKLEEKKPSTTNSSKTLTSEAQPGTLSSLLRAPAVRAGLKRPADDILASPSLSSRPGSIRRLFSRNVLHTAYANADENKEQFVAPRSSATAPSSIITRPDSRSDASLMEDRKARRSSGWFRRLRGGSSDSPASSSGSIVNGSAPRSPLSKRTSMLFANILEHPHSQPHSQPQSLPQLQPQLQHQPQQPAKPAGPPAPMIPELGKLKAKVDLDDGSLSGDLFKNIN